MFWSLITYKCSALFNADLFGKPSRFGTPEDGYWFYRYRWSSSSYANDGKGYGFFMSAEQLQTRQFLKGGDIFILITMKGRLPVLWILATIRLGYNQSTISKIWNGIQLKLVFFQISPVWDFRILFLAPEWQQRSGMKIPPQPLPPLQPLQLSSTAQTKCYSYSVPKCSGVMEL